MALRSAVLLLVSAAAMVGAIAVITSCRDGTVWQATMVALFTASATATALAVFLPFRHRGTAGAAVALLIAGVYGGIAWTAIEAADVGGSCFH